MEQMRENSLMEKIVGWSQIFTIIVLVYISVSETVKRQELESELYRTKNWTREVQFIYMDEHDNVFFDEVMDMPYKVDRVEIRTEDL